MNLFPKINPYKKQFLKVDNNHELYIEQVGNPDGIPIIFLHGGPGAGLNEIYRQYFNPNIYRIILFDQRGSGQSKPCASVENNTTQMLIEDIRKVADELNLKKFILYGGSWGTTLALLYAQDYPETIYSLVLRGVFLCRKKDINWFYQNGASEIFPDQWIKFTKDIPNEEHGDFLEAYHTRIHSSDDNESKKFSKLWAEWEGCCSTLLPSKQVVKQFSDCAVSLSKIETHYFKNNSFIHENQILENIKKIKHLKTFIVHGRYDVVCPINQAYDLHQVHQNSELFIIDDAGHSLLENGITSKILEIFNEADKLYG